MPFFLGTWRHLLVKGATIAFNWRGGGGGKRGEREGKERDVIKRGNRRDCSAGVSLELLKYVFQAKVVCSLLFVFVYLFVCLLFLLISWFTGRKTPVTLLVNRFRLCCLSEGYKLHTSDPQKQTVLLHKEFCLVVADRCNHSRVTRLQTPLSLGWE